MSAAEDLHSHREAIWAFDRRIDTLHLEFDRFRQGKTKIMPDWMRLESELLAFSRRRIVDTELSHQLDRVLYKFQNRKKIWLQWVEDYHGAR
ncbi:MAG: hypothetical protein JRH05_03970 [Deltaproteobacteria bacterium]|nr:hypothetical protein [Deltaproteobacteria bacterium]MBW2101824.1 hypothetical protein [Deltaproteobacteria bacterium]